MNTFIIGAILGIIFAKSKFCFYSGFRDLFYFKDFNFLNSLVFCVFLQSLGLFILSHFQLIHFTEHNFSILATIIGAFSFGIGMALCKGCVSRAFINLFDINFFATAFCFAFSMAVFNGALKHFTYIFKADIQDDFSSPFVFIALAFFSVFLMLKCKKISIVAVFIAVLSLIQWYLTNSGFSLANPSIKLITFLVSNQHYLLDSGLYFLLGFMFAGSLMNYKNKRLNQSVFKSILGGFLMAFGASLASGCNLSNILVATAYFSIQAWLFIPFMLLGFLLSLSRFK